MDNFSVEVSLRLYYHDRILYYHKIQYNTILTASPLAIRPYPPLNGEPRPLPLIIVVEHSPSTKINVELSDPALPLNPPTLTLISRRKDRLANRHRGRQIVRQTDKFKVRLIRHALDFGHFIPSLPLSISLYPCPNLSLSRFL